MAEGLAAERLCCYLGDDPALPGCRKAAEWVIYAESDDPYNVTDACSEHLGLLLDDSPRFTVYPIREVTGGS